MNNNVKVFAVIEEHEKRNILIRNMEIDEHHFSR